MIGNTHQVTLKVFVPQLVSRLSGATLTFMGVGKALKFWDN